ncbi:MAG: O-antigen ligase domain-containing protein [Acidobacteria bacterium]|nr:MAG: O-antigen ligase domain-containing protein [Acidobacteriota bacterium]
MRSTDGASAWVTLLGAVALAAGAFAWATARAPALGTLALVGLAACVGGVILLRLAGSNVLNLMACLGVAIVDISIIGSFTAGVRIDIELAVKVGIVGGGAVLALVAWRRGAIVGSELIVLAYGAICLASAFYSEVVSFSLGAAGVVVCQLLLAIGLSRTYRDSDDLLRTTGWLVAAFSAKLVFSWILLAVAPGFVLASQNPFAEAGWLGMPRFGGVAGPNTMALNLALLVAMAVAMLSKWDGTRRGRIVLGGLGSWAAGTLLLTQSRTSVAAVMAAVGGILYNRRRRVALVALGLGVVVLGFAIPWESVDVLSAVSRTGRRGEAISMAGRTAIWEAVIPEVARSPVLGRGYGSGREIIGNLHVRGATRSFYSAHNMVLESMLNVGAAGTLLLLVVVGGGGVRAFRLVARARQLGDSGAERSGLVLLGVGVVILVNGITESGPAGVLTVPTMLSAWVFCSAGRMLALLEVAAREGGRARAGEMKRAAGIVGDMAG